MKPTIILHIGRHKTGTSSIQASLSESRALLKQQGVLYPGPKFHSGFFEKAFSTNLRNFAKHRNISDNVYNRLVAKGTEYLESLSDEAINFSGKIILSAESACNFNLESISNMKKKLDKYIMPADYKIVLYTRNPVTKANSGIQQLVKGNGLTFEDAISQHLKSPGIYAKIIEKYSSVFKDTEITVRAFKDALANTGCIVEDFCVLFGINLNFPVLRQNDSIAAEIIYFLSWLYEGPRRSGIKPGKPIRVNRKTRVPILNNDKNILYQIKGAKPSFLDQNDADTIWTNLKEDIEYLSVNYGIRYQKPILESKNKDLFSSNFLNQVDLLLPSLSGPVQNKLKRFLTLQGVM